MPSSRSDVVHVPLLPLIQLTAAFVGQKVGKTQDGIQWSSQFMAHCRKESIFELAGSLCVFLCAYQFCFRSSALPYFVGDNDAVRRQHDKNEYDEQRNGENKDARCNVQMDLMRV